jgi:putative restriction endonuclease
VNPENGLLLSALWDAVFDRGLVRFADDGRVLSLAGLSGSSFAVLAVGRAPVLRDLSPGNRERLRWHRGVFGA